MISNGIVNLIMQMSVLVFKAVRETKNNHYIIIAVILHTLGNIPAALYQSDIYPRFATEVISIVYSIAVCLYAYNVYKTLHKNDMEKKEKNFNVAGKKLTN